MWDGVAVRRYVPCTVYLAPALDCSGYVRDDPVSGKGWWFCFGINSSQQVVVEGVRDTREQAEAEVEQAFLR